AGTLAGNPIATAAGLATLQHLESNPGLYDDIERAGETVESHLVTAMATTGLPGIVNHIGGMVGVFLGLETVSCWDDLDSLDQDLFARFFHAAWDRGVLLPPSPYEAWFLMEAHLDGILDLAVEALAEAIVEAGT
ncbi:MAG: glutamate-semialdehyde -aminomutase, partial [Acidimicrobiia bacterium]|nr:glutamate-semialdehyde -aminomutase [Acidimicrobiia bacterium]